MVALRNRNLVLLVLSFRNKNVEWLQDQNKYYWEYRLHTQNWTLFCMNHDLQTDSGRCRISPGLKIFVSKKKMKDEHFPLTETSIAP